VNNRLSPSSTKRLATNRSFDAGTLRKLT